MSVGKQDAIIWSEHINTFGSCPRLGNTANSTATDMNNYIIILYRK